MYSLLTLFALSTACIFQMVHAMEDGHKPSGRRVAQSSKKERHFAFKGQAYVVHADSLPTKLFGSSSMYRQSPSSIANAKHMIPTKKEFVAAFVANHYEAPSDLQYRGFVKGIDTNTFTNKREVAMFVAHAMHESGGLLVKIEERCLEDNCRHDYRRNRDPSDKFYFGRGYLQLTWSYNYKAASKAIFGDPNVLLEYPERVAAEEELCWKAAFWFWRAHIHRSSGVQKGQFGSSTLKLNGDQECGENAGYLAKRRFRLYSNTLRAFHIDEEPNPDGCY